jgi:hypothetical protein
VKNSPIVETGRNWVRKRNKSPWMTLRNQRRLIPIRTRGSYDIVARLVMNQISKVRNPSVSPNTMARPIQPQKLTLGLGVSILPTARPSQ